MASLYKQIYDKKNQNNDSWILNDTFNECVRLKNPYGSTGGEVPIWKVLSFLEGPTEEPNEINNYDGYYTGCIKGPKKNTTRPINGYKQINGTGYAKALKMKDYNDRTNNEVNIQLDKTEKIIDGCGWYLNDHIYAYAKDWDNSMYGAPPVDNNVDLGIPKKRLECCLSYTAGNKDQLSKCPSEYCIDSNICTGPNSEPLQWCTGGNSINKLDENYITEYNASNIEYAKKLLNDGDCLKWLMSDYDNQFFYGQKLSKFFNKISELLINETDKNNINDYLELFKTDGAKMYVRQLDSTSLFNKNIGNFCNNKGKSNLFNFTESNYDDLVGEYGNICNCYWSEKLIGSPPYLYDQKIRELKNMNLGDDINKAFQYSSDVATRGNNKCWFQPCNNSINTDLIPQDPEPRCPTINTAMCGSKLDFINQGTINAESIKLVNKCIATVESGIDPFPDNDSDVISCEGGNAPLFGISKENIDTFAYACNDYRNNIMREKENIEGCKFCNNDRTCRSFTNENKDTICDEDVYICELNGLEKIDKLEELCNKCKNDANNANNTKCIGDCNWCDNNLEEYIKSTDFSIKNKRVCDTNINNKEVLELTCNYLSENNYNQCDWCSDIDKYIKDKTIDDETIDDETIDDKTIKVKNKTFWNKYKWKIIISIVVAFITFITFIAFIIYYKYN